MPITWQQVKAIAMIHSQMGIEDKEDVCERPPNPTWKLVQLLISEVDRLTPLAVEWYSVEDKIPEVLELVQAYDIDDETEMSFAAYINQQKEWRRMSVKEADGYDDEEVIVTHWAYQTSPD